MTELKTKFPEESGDYKVVQLEMDGTQYLWTVTSGGHARCLTYLLEEEGGRFGMYPELGGTPYKRWMDRSPKPEEEKDMKTYQTVDDLSAPDFLDEHVPALDGGGYHVLGMGRVRLDVESKVATFYGKSKSYEIGLDTQQLSLLERLKPDLRIEK